MARLESDDLVKVPFVMSRTFFSSVLVSLGGWALADSWGLLTSATRVFAYHQGAATLAALYFGVQANEFFFFLKHSSDKVRLQGVPAPGDPPGASPRTLLAPP